MSAFLAAALSFPTVVFTVLLVVFLLYAIATLIGALDIEALDGALGADPVEGGALGNGLEALGIAGIPVGIFGGVASLFAWITSFLAARFLPDLLAMNVMILAGAGIVGVAAAAGAVRPLRRIFNTPEAMLNREIVGKVCTIRSLHVDEQAGTAEVEDGGAGIIAEVRCFRENELTLGSKAIVYDYDAKRGVYHVGPIDSLIEAETIVGSASPFRSEA
jgi:hypothetical protein